MTAVAASAADAPAPTTGASARPAVPWRAVVPAAVVLAFADGFWAIALRGAVGAIERTQTPFESWWQESMLLLPLFGLGVLAALVVAQRWFGSSPRGARAALTTAALVAVGATVVGLAVMTISAAVDYRLQLGQLGTMGQMGHDCVTGTCLASAEQATRDLQVRSLGVALALLLGTNLVLVLWVLAFQGGRWNLGGRARRSSTLLRSRLPRLVAARARTRLDDVRLWLVGGLLGAAVVHVSVVPEHLSEWPAAGVFFIALALVEVMAAGPVLDRPVRTAAAIAATLSVAPLAVWLWSRTVGLPFGPDPGATESIGLADTAACLLEVATLALAVTMLRRSRQLDRPPGGGNVSRLALLTAAAVTVVGVGSGFGIFGQAAPGEDGHHGEVLNQTSQER